MKKSDIMPQLVTTIGEGYAQSLDCLYYTGVSNKVTVKGSEISVICFENPPNSNKMIYINGGDYVNFSEAPVDIKVASFTNVVGDLCESRKILPSNLGCSTNSSVARIYSGDNVRVEDAHICREFVLGPVTSQVIRTGGNVILPPGTRRVYIVTSIETNNMSVVAINFEWWEEFIG